MFSEVEFVKRAHVHEIRVFASHRICKLIFLGRLVITAPFAQLTNRLFVHSFQDVLRRKARPNDYKHDLLASIESVFAADQTRNTAITSPILPHRAKVWESAGQMLVLIVSFFLVTPYDVPLWIA